MGLLAAWLGFTLPLPALALIRCSPTAWPSTSRACRIGLGVRGLKIVAVAIVAAGCVGWAKTLRPDHRRRHRHPCRAADPGALPSAIGQVAAILVAGVLGRWARSRRPPPRCPAATARLRHSSKARARYLRSPSPYCCSACRCGQRSRRGSPTVSAARRLLPIAGRAGVRRRTRRAAAAGIRSCRPASWATTTSSQATGRRRRFRGRSSPSRPHLGAVARGRCTDGSGDSCCWSRCSCRPSCWSKPRCHSGKTCAGAAVSSRPWPGINAGVVGLLGSALYDPVWTSAIHSKADFGIALAAFGLLLYARISPVIVVALAALADGRCRRVADGASVQQRSLPQRARRVPQVPPALPHEVRGIAEAHAHADLRDAPSVEPGSPSMRWAACIRNPANAVAKVVAPSARQRCKLGVRTGPAPLRHARAAVRPGSAWRSRMAASTR